MPTLTNNFTNPVILDDDRDPYVSWQHHRERGSQGGVDLAYPQGTPVLAISDGICETVPNYGTGGNTLRLRLDDGSYVEYMHLDSFARGTGDWVSVGDVIGYSGNTGGDYAPHLHVHVYVNGVRCNVWDYFTGSNSDQSAPSTSSSVGEVLWSGDDWSYVDPKGEVAARIQAAASTLGFYNRDDGSARPADGDFAEFSRMAVQRILADSGTFVGDIDGEIWRGGCYGIQDFATALGNYAGRGGVRDGAPRLLSWTCFADGLDVYVASKQTPAAPVAVEPVPEPVPAPAAEPEQTTSVSETATSVEASGTADAPVATEEQPAVGGASDATHATSTPPEPVTPKLITVYRPITQEDVMTIETALPQVEVEDGALGAIITDTKTRQTVYTIWVLIGLTLQGILAAVGAGAVAAVAAVNAGWNIGLVVSAAIFAGIAGAYAALTPQVATLARANTKAKK